MNLRERILACKDLPREQIFVPEWNETVTIQGLTGLQRDQFETKSRKYAAGEGSVSEIRASLIVMACVDEAGSPVFQPGDAELLSQKSGTATERVALAILRLSGLAPGAVEDALGNSEAAPSGDSISA